MTQAAAERETETARSRHVETDGETQSLSDSRGDTQTQTHGGPGAPIRQEGRLVLHTQERVGLEGWPCWGLRSH